MDDISPVANITGKKLKILRKRARLTQNAVVDMCGVSETTICYLERGLRKPHSSTLQRLLNLYAQRIHYWEEMAKALNGEQHAKGTVDS